MPQAFDDLKADLARLLNQDLGSANGNEAEARVRKVIDRLDPPDETLDKFHWEIWLVAGSGFFASGFSLFTTNLILPLLNDEYVATGATCGDYENSGCYNIAASPQFASLTIVGMIIGQLVFGVLGDLKGRTWAYGTELLILMLGIVGVATSDMWFVSYWRLILGIGIGAEYPLSALIVSEWSSTRWRAFTMAAVFHTQWMGQTLAYLCTIGIAKAYDPKYRSAAHDNRSVNGMWRLSVFCGVGCALAAVVFRPLVLETPLWASTHRSEVERLSVPVFSTVQHDVHDLTGGSTGEVHHDHDAAAEDMSAIQRGKAFARGLRDHLVDRRRFGPFVGISAAWFLLDFCFYAIAFSDLDFISVDNETPDDPIVHSFYGYFVEKSHVYDVLLYTCVGLVFGGVLALAIVDRLHRVRWTGWCVFSLSIVFMAIGAVAIAWPRLETFSQFLQTDEIPRMSILILIDVSQFLFNIGPNTLLFIIPAELFGTKHRGTLYGMAGAVGKLGALIMQPIRHELIFKFEPSEGVPGRVRGVMVLFFIMSFAMLLAALVTWAWIPETQTLGPRSRLQNRTLEDIAENPMRDQELGIARVWRRALGLRPASNETQHNGEQSPGETGDDDKRQGSEAASLIRQEDFELPELRLGNGDPGWWTGNGTRHVANQAPGDHQSHGLHRDPEDLAREEGFEFYELPVTPADVRRSWV